MRLLRICSRCHAKSAHLSPARSSAAWTSEPTPTPSKLGNARFGGGIDCSRRTAPEVVHSSKCSPIFAQSSGETPDPRSRGEAEAELEHSTLYYEQCESGLGVEFLCEFEQACARLEKNPQAYARYYRHFRKCNLRRFPFGVVYSIEPDLIYVIAVANLHRRPFYWKARAKKLRR